MRTVGLLYFYSFLTHFQRQVKLLPDFLIATLSLTEQSLHPA